MGLDFGMGFAGVEDELAAQEVPDEDQNAADELGHHEVQVEAAGKEIHKPHRQQQADDGDGDKHGDLRGGADGGIHGLKGEVFRQQEVAGDAHGERTGRGG